MSKQQKIPQAILDKAKELDCRVGEGSEINFGKIDGEKDNFGLLYQLIPNNPVELEKKGLSSRGFIGIENKKIIYWFSPIYPYPQG